MPAFLLAILVALGGCYISDQTPVNYAMCLDASGPTAYCESYYEWVPGWWTIGGEFVPGYYRLRPGYREHLYDHRVIIQRDHRTYDRHGEWHRGRW